MQPAVGLRWRRPGPRADLCTLVTRSWPPCAWHRPGLATSALEAPRAALGFPPFGALASLEGAGRDEFAAELQLDRRVAVLGPADGRYLVRADGPDQLADVLAAVPRPPGARIRVGVDPPRV
ncbi:MAG: hypothetical protein R2705_03445 [Ilumatobacteraceae bacterium]